MSDFEKLAEDNYRRLFQSDRGRGFEFARENFLGPVVAYRFDLGHEIIAVLKFVLDNVVWTEDVKTRGQVEHWGLPILKEVDGVKAWRGDCDDFMSAFMLILRKMGWNEKVLRRAVCFVPTDGRPPADPYVINHAVLCVNFSTGLLFLDNRFRFPMSLFRLRQQGYTNFSVCSVDGFWHTVEGTI